MNNKKIIEFGFRMIRIIMQIQKGGYSGYNIKNLFVCFSGPVHRFKKLCEKLQLILFSNQRRSTSNCRAEDENNEEYRAPDEKDASSNNSKLQLTHLSDTESEGEVLDSPRASTEGVSTNMNGKETEKNG